MKLVTLEGLPHMCHPILNEIHRLKNRGILMIPSPMAPLSTSVQVTPAEDVCTALSNVLVRLTMLQRMKNEPSVVCGGCHWIENLPMPVRERAILNRLFQDLSIALIEEFQIHVEEHLVIILQTSVHECFEYLLKTMEARDYTIYDLIREKRFLETLASIPGSMSPFPCKVFKIPCPSFVCDNAYDIFTVAKRIACIV